MVLDGESRGQQTALVSGIEQGSARYCPDGREYLVARAAAETRGHIPAVGGDIRHNGANQSMADGEAEEEECKFQYQSGWTESSRGWNECQPCTKRQANVGANIPATACPITIKGAETATAKAEGPETTLGILSSDTRFNNAHEYEDLIQQKNAFLEDKQRYLQETGEFLRDTDTNSGKACCKRFRS